MPPQTLASGTRLPILLEQLRQLRARADLHAASDTIHQLRNTVLTAQAALRLAQTRVAQGRSEESEGLLELAEARLRHGRSLIVRAELGQHRTRRWSVADLR